MIQAPCMKQVKLPHDTNTKLEALTKFHKDIHGGGKNSPNKQSVVANLINQAYKLEGLNNE